jgi:hypothetical protein
MNRWAFSPVNSFKELQQKVTKTITAFLMVAIPVFGQSPPRPSYAPQVHIPQPAAPPTTLHSQPRLTGHEANQAAIARWEAQIAPKPVAVAPQQQSQQTQVLPLGAYWYTQQQRQEATQSQTTSATESRALPIDCGPIAISCSATTGITTADPFPLGTSIIDGNNRPVVKGRLFDQLSAISPSPRTVVLTCPADAVYVSQCTVVK